MHLNFDKSILDVMPECKLGYITMKDLSITGVSPALSYDFVALQQEVIKTHKFEALENIPRIAAMRSLYKKLSFDPVRYRPASEELVRLVLQKKNVYYVNSAVDVANYCALRFFLPFGIYDADKIVGSISYKIGEDDEYETASGEICSTKGKPFVADEEGVFGNPTADAKRTVVTLSTKNILCIVFADEEVPDMTIREILFFASGMFEHYNGGSVVSSKVLSAHTL